MVVKQSTTDKHLLWAEINLKALKHNLRSIQKCANQHKFSLPTRPKTFKGKIPPAEILAVIKEDAYGHGVIEVAKLLDQQAINFLGIADVAEGIRLRMQGLKNKILIFESTLPHFAKDIVDYNLTATICTLDLAKSLNEYAQKKSKRIDVHVKVDTGMGRLGVWHKQAFDFIRQVHALKHLRITGILTHFPAADTDRAFTKRQIQILYDLVIRLDQAGTVIPYIHAANSMGLAGYQTHVLNLTRPGLMLYGLYPHPSLKKKISLKPVMSVKSQVIFVKDVAKGQSISYGRTFFSQKDMRVAVIPIGYNDGYFRVFSNQASVLIKGTRCPILGRVTMGQIVVDVSHLTNAKVGDSVVILGRQKSLEITADELAGYAKTISYEIVCALGNRLPRIYKR